MKRFQRYAVVFAALMFVCASLFGQVTTGKLTGNVTLDGAALPGATVTATSPNLQGTRVAYTDINGNYNIGGLPPGLYTVTIEMESMQTVTRTTRVSVNATARVDAEMKLAAVAQAITVTASAPAVVETQEVQSTYSAELVSNLPIGRTLLNTVNLAPGVNSNGPAGATTISGAPSYDSVYFVDGAVANEVLRGQPQSLFIEDAIQETTVQTGAISAEFGRFTGGVVTAVSKSGGNEFSGSFRDSFTNPSWTSTTPLDEDKAKSDVENVYEATFGGRIIRDRLWFFTAGRYFSRDIQNFFVQSTVPFTTGDEEKRYEVKLSGQLTDKHSLVGSWFDLKRDQTDYCFGGCWEPSSIDPARSIPQTFYSINYNGIITNNFLVEGLFAHKNLKFEDSGGEKGAPADASNVYSALTGGYLGFPTFCGSCGAEERPNDNLTIKGTYYLSTKSLGTHNLVAGYDDYSDSIKSNNHQSGSDYTVYSYDVPTRLPDGSVQPTFGQYNTLIIWWPILQNSKGTDFTTRSVFLNDKWDMNNKLSFNVGVRYDDNTGEDSAGAKVASDSKVSPRLGATYDVFGNGKLRLMGTYSEYVSKVSNGNVGDAASPAGSPSYLYWLYYGPTIEGKNTHDALRDLFAWFDSVGGNDNTDFLLGGGTNGISTQIRDKLSSPSVAEYTFGVGSAIGNNAYLRADYQYRDWSNFYTNVLTLDQAGAAFDPLAGTTVDVTLLENSDVFDRNYRAILVQGGYRAFNKLNIGGNYTYSKTRGNYEGETSGSGPVPASGPNYYPELLGYTQRIPTGYLNEDQRHKGRLWVSYDLPTFLGNFNFSALERYDSGTPYSAAGTIELRTSRCPTCNANPGYKFPPSSATYYFSKRGAFRWDDVTATDLSLNYTLPISKINLYFSGQVLNVFDEDAQVDGNTTVLTGRNSSCTQLDNGPNPGQRCLNFNPFTETPVEGIHYRLGSNFGKAQDPTNLRSQGDYQLPRTYMFSVGVKF